MKYLVDYLNWFVFVTTYMLQSKTLLRFLLYRSFERQIQARFDLQNEKIDNLTAVVVKLLAQNEVLKKPSKPDTISRQYSS